ncbi:hypothetical protein [Sulfuricurvum sp.]|uniref:hypothetical protein n=1 Tax=Sulfuricurvum sp. TaxID=2025608 RepID=UPI0026206891|nr:hypothetical protein [Sulfuricurvum sp.]MDD2782389.1 hypothetical protein [Sulfuricurvum sp.]
METYTVNAEKMHELLHALHVKEEKARASIFEQEQAKEYEQLRFLLLETIIKNKGKK